tara:strand:+ start:1789 stop:2079 length:291 start_codon:yes stop_codon:yes gene_type:complete
MDNINMSEEEYKALYNRIKQDLYDEFINPETATYGADVLRQKEAKQNIFSHRITDSDMIREEIEQLKVVMKKYEDDEEYEHAAIMKKRIEYLKRKL